jgi:hypothetical protein
MAKEREQGKDPFANISTEQYEKEGTPHSKAALEDMTEQAMNRTTALLFNEGNIEKLAQGLRRMDKIEGPAEVTTGVMRKVIGAIQKSNANVPPAVMTAVGAQTLESVYEIREAVTDEEVTPKEKQTAFSIVIQKTLDAEIRAGNVDKEELAMDLGRQVKEMTPEQRKYIDGQLKDINQTAVEHTMEKRNPMGQAPQGGLIEEGGMV